MSSPLGAPWLGRPVVQRHAGAGVRGHVIRSVTVRTDWLTAVSNETGAAWRDAGGGGKEVPLC
jgi:hypothetical protein